MSEGSGNGGENERFFQATTAATLIPTAPSATHAIGAHSHMTSTVQGAGYLD